MEKMGQIVKRKKKGRPSNADLAKRRSLGEDISASELELRRSRRQRNVRYTFDFDDYIDDNQLFENFDDEEDERRREKKLKLLHKIQTSRETTATTTTPSTPSETRRGLHAPEASPSSSDLGGDGSYHMPSKKRKMSGTLRRDRHGVDAEREEDEEDENDDVDDDDNENVEDHEVIRGGKADETKGVVQDSAPGTPAEAASGLPLPEKKTLELILDKLQKKDIYGVYAEPVDTEELPDYHEVIKHPMDFATLRKKLGNGSYAILEQFESDVFLICSNAMQYNAPDTIYYKQARSIQELAKKKFEKIRLSVERSEELKSEQKLKLSSVDKKPIRKPISRAFQDPVQSDFSSGATLATPGDFQNGSSTTRVGGSERSGSVDRLVEGPPLIDNNIDKAEELFSGKRPLFRIERKPSLNDENRRATYKLSSQPVVSSDSVLSTFEGESKQLVSVGLYTDHSYARSLARFAATLGPIAWGIASKRIEQALPSESKFGRGWVGEYESLPTPVLMLENCTLKEPPFFMKIEPTVLSKKEEKMPTKPVSSKENIVIAPHVERLAKAAPYYKDRTVKDSTIERTSAFFGSTVIKPTATSSSSISFPAKEQAVIVSGLEAGSFFGSPANEIAFSASSFRQQNSQPRNFIEREEKVVEQVELNGPPSGSQSATDFVGERQMFNSSETPASRSKAMVSKKKNFMPGSFKQPNLNGVSIGKLPNGKVNNLVSNKTSSSSPDVAKAVTYFPHVRDQGFMDPVQLMRTVAEKAQDQHKSPNHFSVDSSPLVSSSPLLRKEDSGNAAADAARAWMSIGAGGFRPAGEYTNPHKNEISANLLYNPDRDIQSQVSQFRGDPPSYGNSFPFHTFVPQPARMGSNAQFQNQQIVYPQSATADLSRFPVQSPWHSLSPQMQLRQKQESLPPDLNISFPSSGSPGTAAPSVLVDSQQPDLALQL